jgi:hypothetical protein
MQLQKEYKQKYLEIIKKYNCKLIIVLQFNPKSENFKNEIIESAKFIKENFDNSCLIGIPFGNDFKILQKDNNFSIIDNIFDSILKGYYAHILALGTIDKLKKYGLKSYIYSIDASSVNLWSRNYHYCSKTGKIADIRSLTQKRGLKAYNNAVSKFNADNQNINDWLNSKFEYRFNINIKNFNYCVEKIYAMQIDMYIAKLVKENF